MQYLLNLLTGELTVFKAIPHTECKFHQFLSQNRAHDSIRTLFIDCNISNAPTVKAGVARTITPVSCTLLILED